MGARRELELQLAVSHRHMGSGDFWKSSMFTTEYTTEPDLQTEELYILYIFLKQEKIMILADLH